MTRTHWPVNIGSAAALSGISAKMVRHYESRWLLPNVTRTDGGYRQYSAADVHTLRFIKRSRDLGFSMTEIAELVALWQNRRRTIAMAASGPAARFLTTWPSRRPTPAKRPVDGAGPVFNNDLNPHHRSNSMKSNVGGIDRIIRILVGVVLVALAATNTVGWWGWLGIIPLATGLLGWCPPYALLGFNTCSVKDSPKA